MIHEAKFETGETLIIGDSPDKSYDGKEVVVIDARKFVRNTKVSAVEIWEYKVAEGTNRLGWLPEYHLERLNKPLKHHLEQ